jgi:hypothetical protein
VDRLAANQRVLGLDVVALLRGDDVALDKVLMPERGDRYRPSDRLMTKM